MLQNRKNPSHVIIFGRAPKASIFVRVFRKERSLLSVPKNSCQLIGNYSYEEINVLGVAVMKYKC